MQSSLLDQGCRAALPVDLEVTRRQPEQRQVNAKQYPLKHICAQSTHTLVGVLLYSYWGPPRLETGKP